MRPLIVSALAAALVGCTWFAPQQAQQASLMGNSATDTPTDSYTGAKAEKGMNAKTRHRRHRWRTSETKIAKANRVPRMDTSRVQLEDKSSTSINAESTVAAKTVTQQVTPPDNKSGTSINAHSTVGAKTETQQAAPPDNKSSTSTNAQSTVAAKTETQQAAQLNDKSDPVLKKAMSAIAEKMQNSASVELVDMKRAEKNAPGKSVDTICGDVRGKSAAGLDTGERPFLYLVKEDQAYIGLYDIATSPYHNLCDK